MASLRLPNRVEVCGISYEIFKETKEWADSHSRDAECDVSGSRIRINADSSPDRQAMLLLHEILHACWDAVELPDEADEETVISHLAHVLHDTLKRNPELIRFIQLAK